MSDMSNLRCPFLSSYVFLSSLSISVLVVYFALVPVSALVVFFALVSVSALVFTSVLYLTGDCEDCHKRNAYSDRADTVQRCLPLKK